MPDTVPDSGALASQPPTFTFFSYFTTSSLNSLPACKLGTSTNTETAGIQEIGETLPSLKSH